MSRVEERLRALRGLPEPRPHSARTIAALAANPGCARRAVLDAAGVDKRRTATDAGFPAPFGQSQFAITREAAFAARLRSDGCAELLALLRERLGLGEREIGYVDLDGGDPLSSTRTDVLLDGAAITLEIGGQLARIDSDVLILALEGRWHTVEIKSFPIIDGQADPGKASAASIQAAVQVHALRQLGAEVSHEVVLVCPEGFSNRPAAALLDVRKQLTVLRRQLQRMSRIESILDALPASVTFDPAEGDPTESLQAVPARYAPSCLSTCELCYFCRNESGDGTAVLGPAVREQLGGVTTAVEALAVARGEVASGPEHDALRLAYALRREILDGDA